MMRLKFASAQKCCRGLGVRVHATPCKVAPVTQNILASPNIPTAIFAASYALFALPAYAASEADNLLESSTAVAVAAQKTDGGWLAPLTDSLEAGLRFLQAGLDALHVPYSYGYSIILLTLAVKLATFPLTKQQVESQLAVQSLKPRIDLIKARYGEDKDRVSKETSLLYEQAGVNPLAGCLPTLATIPIFIGLYRSLTNVANAGLLEDQGFYWIPSLAGPTDLAHRGTAWLFPFVDGAPPIGWEQGLAYASLPALLVVAQYISSAVISPPVDPADPNANTTKVVSALAPWMVAYFALNVPAGLGLYYLTNTVLTLAVQLYLRKLGGAKAMTKPGSGRRTGLEAGSFVRWQSATAAAVAAQKAAELARDEDEADTSALAAVAGTAGSDSNGTTSQEMSDTEVSWVVKRRKLALIPRA
ncbi:hypothetical protein QJQ45_006269 [Haematococcus lacustris]|nr:hypothetical protein QJQ45_006269 [Haematococcus lacustris]